MLHRTAISIPPGWDQLAGFAITIETLLKILLTLLDTPGIIDPVRARRARSPTGRSRSSIETAAGECISFFMRSPAACTKYALNPL